MAVQRIYKLHCKLCNYALSQSVSLVRQGATFRGIRHLRHHLFVANDCPPRSNNFSFYGLATCLEHSGHILHVLWDEWLGLTHRPTTYESLHPNVSNLCFD